VEVWRRCSAEWVSTLIGGAFIAARSHAVVWRLNLGWDVFMGAPKNVTSTIVAFGAKRLLIGHSKFSEEYLTC
jgi:hypothetical protein